MKPYILLTPGPLTTTETVKEAMMTDWCTWDEDYNVHIVEEIRNSLVALSSRHPDEYTSILLQGSGTYCVEAVIGSTIKPGTPCIHLLALLIIKSTPNSCKSMGMPPKLLIASTISRLPYTLTM